MKRLFAVWIIVLLAGCAQKPSVLTIPTRSIWLGLKFLPGKSTTYKQTTNISTTIEAEGFSQTINTAIEMQTTETVEDTGDVTIVKVSFDNVIGTVRTGSQLKSIDELDGLQGVTASLKLSRDGKITEVKGFENVDYFKKSGEDPAQQFEESFGFLPNKTTKVGEMWTREFDEIKATYTLKGFEKKGDSDCAKIAVLQAIKTTRNGAEKGMKTRLEIEGTGKGTVWVDIERGVVIESEIKISLEGNQEISGRMAPEPMTMPIYIDQDSHRKIVE
jgi:hypothetical protein